MKSGLTYFSLAALIALVGVSIWATGEQSISPALQALAMQPSGNPWLVATLFDAYFGFLWFWLWVAYKETSWLARVVWLVLILALGNIAMASFMLIQLMRLPAGAKIEDLLLRGSA